MTGSWESVRSGHDLLSLDGDRVLDWEPATKRFRLWRYDRNSTTLRRATLRLHLRIRTQPKVSLDLMVANMRARYGSYGIEVIVASRENVVAPGNTFEVIDIGECSLTEGPTADVTDLFNHFRANVGPKELVVYFVSTLMPDKAGCATHPPDKPGAMVAARDSDDWTLAHEIGHVLGLADLTFIDRNRLMNRGGKRSSPPPELTTEEVATIFQSDLTQE